MCTRPWAVRTWKGGWVGAGGEWGVGMWVGVEVGHEMGDWEKETRVMGGATLTAQTGGEQGCRVRTVQTNRSWFEGGGGNGSPGRVEGQQSKAL